MSTGASTASPTLCLGEAIVDFVPRPPTAALGDAARFEPHPGGISANVAAFAVRAGAAAALVGAVGDDRWGRWLRERLAREGVDTAALASAPGRATQLAFVSVDADGDAGYMLYGSPACPLDGLLPSRLDRLVAGAAALFVSTNTLADAPERELTLRAVALARALGRPVLFDCNLRMHRWLSVEQAVACSRACIDGALLVRANAEETALLTGERDPAAAAAALLALGARLVVLTAGGGRVTVRGADGTAVDRDPRPVAVTTTVGAGDALTGTLVAALARGGFAPAAALAALPAALDAAAAACRRRGALD